MADLVQTAANVGLSGDDRSKTQEVQYGEAITQGMPVYLKAGTNKYFKADALTSDKADAKGIALTPGAADERGIIAQDGTDIDLGATLTVGETYGVSSNSGAIGPTSDRTSGQFVTILGVAETANRLPIKINASGAAVP